MAQRTKGERHRHFLLAFRERTEYDDTGSACRAFCIDCACTATAVIRKGRMIMFRRIREEDRKLYYHYADVFYHTDAVNAPVPAENYAAAFDEMMRCDAYLRGYLFEDGGEVCGFALLSKTYSQEAGGVSVTIEEIYIDEDHRGKGLATEFFEFLKAQENIMRLRIEVEDANEGAKRLYGRMGFEVLPYLQMVIDRQRQ